MGSGHPIRPHQPLILVDGTIQIGQLVARRDAAIVLIEHEAIVARPKHLIEGFEVLLATLTTQDAPLAFAFLRSASFNKCSGPV